MNWPETSPGEFPKGKTARRKSKPRNQTRKIQVDASDFRSTVISLTGLKSSQDESLHQITSPGAQSHVCTLKDGELVEGLDTSFSVADEGESIDQPRVADMELQYAQLQNLPYPVEMRDCCSIFFLLPEDYEFEVDTLIQLWMAGDNNIKDELMGQKCFLSLLYEGYLLDTRTTFVTRKNRYRINKEKLKDFLVREKDNHNFYLKWESEAQKNNTSTETQHISLVCNNIDASIFQTLQQFNELQTLLFLGNYGNKVQHLPENLFTSFKKLQALDLSHTDLKKLSSSVCCMIQLRYLNLSHTLIESLPDVICSLKKLQTLKLRGCSKLRELPRKLKKLTKLRHLDVDVLRQLATIPRGLGALVNLRTLSAFLVGTEEGFKIQELKELDNLTGDFCIAMLENVSCADEAKEAALNNKHGIDKLELRWTASQLSRTQNNCYDVLEHLQPCSSLKELQILCYEGTVIPDWVSDPAINRLTSITFFKCELVSELPLFEDLPFLQHLQLAKMNGVKKIDCRGKSGRAVFFRLEKLEIDEMRSLEDWRWVKTDEDDFKSLTELTISDCPRLHEFHVLHCLSSIKHLEIRGCLELESLSETKLSDSLEELIVEDCPRVKSRCTQKGKDWYKIQHISNLRICEEEDDEDDGSSNEDEC